MHYAQTVAATEDLISCYKYTAGLDYGKLIDVRSVHVESLTPRA